MSFAHPAFLWGLLAVAIPVAVHLFNFRRYRILYFSNTRFLKELKKNTKRRSQLKKLLILSLRILTIVAIVMAFAQPIFKKNEKNINKGNACIELYIDNSYSMNNTGKNGSLLHEAKEKAKSIVDACEESDIFMLLTNDFEGKHARFFNKTEIKSEIDAVENSPFSKSFENIIEYGYSFFKNEDSPNKQIFIISDFQKNQFNIKKLPEDSNISVNFVPLVPNHTNNFYIDTCWFDSPVFLSGNEIKLHAIVVNESQNDVEKLPVKLYINEKQISIATADIKAGGKSIIDIPFTMENEGLQQARLDITDYPITHDDKLYFSFSVDDKFNVLNIYESSDSPYLYALFGKDSSVNYRKLSVKRMDYSILSSQNLIIFDGIENPNSACLQEIKNYVENGGNLLIIPSDNKNNTLTNEINNNLGITPFNDLDTQASRVEGINYENRLFFNTFKEIPENMNLPVIFKHYRTSNTLQQNKEVLLKLENQDEFLSVQNLGKGNIYLLCSPLEDSFGEFQNHAIFVPVLYNMSIFGNKPLKPYYIIGRNENLSLEADKFSGDAIFEIRNDKLHFSCIPETRNRMSYYDIFLHDQIREAENYLLCRKKDSLNYISYNFDRRESELEFYSQNDLKPLTLGQKKFKIISGNKQSANIIAENIHGNNNYNSLFIWLALALLFIETVLLKVWKQ